jgi:hypothetical protein
MQPAGGVKVGALVKSSKILRATAFGVNANCTDNKSASNEDSSKPAAVRIRILSKRAVRGHAPATVSYWTASAFSATISASCHGRQSGQMEPSWNVSPLPINSSSWARFSALNRTKYRWWRWLRLSPVLDSPLDSLS